MIEFFPLLFSLLAVPIAAAVSAAAEKRILPGLCAAAKQPIYEGGPAWHMSKSGTPTMGGAVFFPAALIASLPALIVFGVQGMGKEAVSLSLTLGYAALNGLIGVFDDLKKLRRKQNAGLSPIEKLLLQGLFAALYLFARANLLGKETELAFSFGRIDLGGLYYPLAFLLLLFFVNSVNLTDGVDGLAASVSFGMGCAFLIYAFRLGSASGVVGAAVLIGTGAGFLFFNFHPAKVFMGDTGSLFLGGWIAAAAFSIGRPAALVTSGGFFCFEGISVLLQVAVYKLTKKRVFRMAPFHHHLERSGFREETICFLALAVTALLSSVAYLLL